MLQYAPSESTNRASHPSEILLHAQRDSLSMRADNTPFALMERGLFQQSFQG